MLHAKETGISSVHLDLLLICTFTFFFSVQIMYLEAVVGKVAVLFQGFMEYFFYLSRIFYKITLIASFCCLFSPE